MSLLATLKDRWFSSRQSVELVVYVPPETPAGEVIYVAGSCKKLGEWDPRAVPLRPKGDGVWRARVALPPDQPVEFKVTRGSWEKVEKAADGGDLGNTWVGPGELADGVIRHRVERWADAG